MPLLTRSMRLFVYCILFFVLFFTKNGSFIYKRQLSTLFDLACISTGFCTVPLIQMKDCIFCNYPESNLIYSDLKYSAFLDINPASSQHYLIIPKFHIENVYSLTPNNLTMIKEMVKIGESLQVHGKEYLVGFHVPPFTSVNHLHLHFIQKPLRNWFRRLKYPSSGEWKWWVRIDVLIDSMERAQARREVGTWSWKWV